MRKTFEQANEEAIQHSKEFPECTVKVMKKPRYGCKVITFDWVYHGLVLEEYHTETTYKNGVQC